MILFHGVHTRAAEVDANTLAAAKQLHQEAMAALEAHQFASACPKLEQVVRMIPEGYGARLSLGECYESAGQLASAWQAFVIVEESSPKPEQRGEARSRANALFPKLARLVLIVPQELSKIEDLEIRLNKAKLAKTVLNTPFPVDRGMHTISVQARGYQPWKRTLSLIENGEKAEVEIPMLAKSVPSAAGKDARDLRQETQASAWSTQRWAGLIIGIAGFAGLITGSAFGIEAIQLRNASNAGGKCRADDFCTPEGFELRTKSIDSGNWSTGFVAGGAAAAALGAALWLSAPKSQGTVRLAGTVGTTHGKLELQVTW